MSPAAVVSNAFAIPEAKAVGRPLPTVEIMANDCIIPSIVPSSPRSGATVDIVERAAINLSNFGSSLFA